MESHGRCAGQSLKLWTQHHESSEDVAAEREARSVKQDSLQAGGASRTTRTHRVLCDVPMQGKRKHGGRVRRGRRSRRTGSRAVVWDDDHADDVRRRMGTIYRPHVGVNESVLCYLFRVVTWFRRAFTVRSQLHTRHRSLEHTARRHRLEVGDYLATPPTTPPAHTPGSPPQSRTSF
jgi:hypothetical protein